MILEITVNDLD